MYWWSKEKAATRGYVTSFTWIIGESNHPLTRIAVLFEERFGVNRIVSFCGVQLFYTSLTLLPVKLIYEVSWVHTSFLVFLVFWVVWFGANWYVEVFTKQYFKHLEKAREKKTSGQGKDNDDEEDDVEQLDHVRNDIERHVGQDEDHGERSTKGNERKTKNNKGKRK